MYDVIVIGGGAAGVFAAAQAHQSHPKARILLIEKSARLLSKVKVSGGGRCNVTHACFDPKKLIQNYPRGGKELLGPFSIFQPKDTIAWFEAHGVFLKTESDGRMFPITDSSQTIIDCLLQALRGVEIRYRASIQEIQPGIDAPKIIVATGSSSEGLQWAEKLGHTIQSPVPSLFTANIPTSPLKELSGITVEDVIVSSGPFSQRGSLLITHFGFSGPAILKLSSWGARYFFSKAYQTPITINWLPDLLESEIFEKLLHLKETSPQKMIDADSQFYLPRNLWKALTFSKRWVDVSHKELHKLAAKLHADPYQMDGKTTHKEEFVTCGGITLKEIDFKTMESKICKGVYFAGEILDIDAVTGGFNFQNAWTTGYISGYY